MKKITQILFMGGLTIALFGAFTNINLPDADGGRNSELYMLGIELFKGDESPLNNTNVKIEIYDHELEETVFTRDYSQQRTNKFSSYSIFENLKYGNDVTLLIQAPNYLAKEITISYDSLCLVYSKFCVNGLDMPPYEINGAYADRYVFPIQMDSLVVGEELIIPNIYYNYNSAQLLPGSMWILDSVARVIENNPFLKIELGGHADARGGDNYNLALSQQRVNATKNYLLKRLDSASGDRIEAIGYGETRLLNHCSNGQNCGESQHQQNRRTTFKIVSNENPESSLTLAERVRKRQVSGD